MRFIQKCIVRKDLGRASVWVTAAGLAALAAAVMLPAAAAAEVEETPATSCSSSPHHISDLSQSGSSCTKALRVAKFAVKDKNSFSWSYGGFHCPGESTEGMPPISFTCKKSSSRIYFTYE